MNSTLCQAISKRAVIQIFYDGGFRTIEPHCHGISKAGNEVLRAFQTGGFSKSGESMGWKLLLVGKMRNIEDTGAVFVDNRPGYNPNDSGMISIHCHV